MKKNTVTVGVVAILAGALMGVAQAEPPKKTRRVWTNDDFTPAAAPVAPAADKMPAAPAKLELSENGDDYTRLRKEVNDELVESARARDKTYEESLALIQKRMETEPDPFRVEVLKKIIADTEQLRESNRRILKQFGAAGKPGSDKNEPAPPAASSKDQKEL